jgi:hypothetical protein
MREMAWSSGSAAEGKVSVSCSTAGRVSDSGEHFQDALRIYLKSGYLVLRHVGKLSMDLAGCLSCHCQDVYHPVAQRGSLPFVHHSFRDKHQLNHASGQLEAVCEDISDNPPIASRRQFNCGIPDAPANSRKWKTRAARGFRSTD